jgi:hypothetical protein
MDELTEADLLYVLDSIGAIESLDGSRSEKDLQVLRQMRLFEVAEGVLAEVEIPPTDVKEGLDEDQVFRLRWRLNNTQVPNNDGPEEKIPAIAILTSIAAHSKQLLYPAKAENMQATWAKEYHDGYFTQWKTQVVKALESGESTDSTGAGALDDVSRPYYFVRVTFRHLIFVLYLKRKSRPLTRNPHLLENCRLLFQHRRLLEEAAQGSR